MDIQDFVRNVKRILDERGISYSRAGKESGAGIDFIRDMDRKGSWPSTEKILKMADYLDVSLDYLLGRTINAKIPTLGIEDGLSEEQQELVSLYESAPPALQAAALAVLRSADEPVIALTEKWENGKLILRSKKLDAGQAEGQGARQVNIITGQLNGLETRPSKIRKEQLKELNKRLEAMRSTKRTGSGHGDE